MSTGTSGNIVAGQASVVAWLDDHPLSQGLAKLSNKLKQWQSSLSKIGAGSYGGQLPMPFAAIARFAASPAGAFAALLGAAKHTADVRAEMLMMSQTTGVAVDKLSKYAYAARRAGIDNATFAAGLKKLQSKEFQMALQGMGGIPKPGKGDLLGLGRGGDAIDRLRAFMEATKNLNAGDRAGLAKKYGISELLPLLALGIEQMDAFTARAHELGLVMGEEDAKAGKRFGLAFGDLHDVLMSSVSAIGGALVPVITGLTDNVVKVAAVVRDWLKEHQGLTQALFYGTGAIVGGGIALKGLSFVAGAAADAIKLVQFAVKGLGIAFDVFKTAVSWLPMLANPWVLAGLAIGGLIVLGGKLIGAFDGIGDMFQNIAGDAVTAFGAITNAVSNGDLSAAWGVVTAFISTEWTRVTNFLAEAFGNVCDFIREKLFVFIPWFSQIAAAIDKAWTWTTDRLKEGMEYASKVWTNTINYWKAIFAEAVGFLIKKWDELLDRVARYTYESGVAADKAEHARQKAGFQQTLLETQGPEALAKSKEQDAAAAAFKAAHGGDLAFDPRTARLAEQQSDAAVAAALTAERKKARALEAETALQDAQAKFKEAVDKANAVKMQSPGGGQSDKDKDLFQAAAATENRGTYSGAVAGLLGGGDAAEQAQLRELENASNLAQKQLEKMDQQIEAVNRLRTALDNMTIA
jgi:hypothetical protein